MQTSNKRIRQGTTQDILVQFHFSTYDDTISTSVDELQCMLQKQLRHNSSKRFMACVIAKRVEIYDSTTWKVVQTITDVNYSDSSFVYFIGQHEVLIGLGGTLKVWDIRKAKFTKSIETNLSFELIHLLAKNYLVLYDADQVTVFNITKDKVTTKYIDQVCHVCIHNNELVTLQNHPKIVFWNLETMDMLRRIDIENNYSYICKWFGNKWILSNMSETVVFDMVTELNNVQLPRVVLYTVPYKNYIITAVDDPSGVAVWSDQSNYRMFPLEFDNYMYHNPFGVVGSKLVFLQMQEEFGKVGNNVKIFDIESGELIREIEGEFTLMSTWGE